MSRELLPILNMGSWMPEWRDEGASVLMVADGEYYRLDQHEVRTLGGWLNGWSQASSTRPGALEAAMPPLVAQPGALIPQRGRQSLMELLGVCIRDIEHCVDTAGERGVAPAEMALAWKAEAAAALLAKARALLEGGG